MEENKQIQTVDSTTEIVDTQGATNKLAAMMAFIKANLEKGIDYMSIGGGKPTLMKQGAEKMNILMGFYPEYEILNEITNPADNYYDATIKCILRSRKDHSKVAEGIASCNNKEAAKVKEAETRHIDMYSQKNSILKIAEKRAYVGATLNANALSQFYTQDLEDEVVEPKKDSNGAILSCLECGREVSPKVAEFSAKRFGKILCMAHQNPKEPQN